MGWIWLDITCFWFEAVTTIFLGVPLWQAASQSESLHLPRPLGQLERAPPATCFAQCDDLPDSGLAGPQNMVGGRNKTLDGQSPDVSMQNESNPSEKGAYDILFKWPPAIFLLHWPLLLERWSGPDSQIDKHYCAYCTIPLPGTVIAFYQTRVQQVYKMVFIYHLFSSFLTESYGARGMAGFQQPPSIGNASKQTLQPSSTRTSLPNCRRDMFFVAAFSCRRCKGANH